MVLKMDKYVENGFDSNRCRHLRFRLFHVGVQCLFVFCFSSILRVDVDTSECARPHAEQYVC